MTAPRTARFAAVGILAAATAFTVLPGSAPAAPQPGSTARIAGASSGTTVPAAATASDSLRRFVEQRPDWRACEHEELDEAGARCATIRVPLDYRKPAGRTITVGFSRIKATDTRHRIGVMMHNSGGPGGITLDMPLLSVPAMGRELAARYDLVGMDPRGVGRSSALHCGTSGHWLRSAGYDTAGFRAQARYEARLVDSCRKRYGKNLSYLRHFTTRNTARDMDLLREVLGERRTSYFGVSYGTYLGAAYANMFPGRTDRLLLDSAIDPARWNVSMLRDAAPANERFLDAWARWAARRDGTYGLGRTAAEVRANVEGIARRAAKEPLTVGRYTADGQLVPMVLAATMADDRQFARAAKNIRVLYDASRGRTVRPTEDLALFLGRPTADMDTQNSLQLALQCGDVRAPRDLAWYRRNVERSRAKAPLFGPLFNGVNPCALWPNEPLEPPVRTGNAAPGLIVQSTGDPRTSYGNGLGLHRRMPNSRMVTIRAQVHGVYSMYPNRCVDRTVNDYLRTGELPARDTVCEKDRGRGAG
ncbi:alpha/beta hydrolase [Streptomyces sp. NPDC001922]|uniref:alpha/beta hydrolase n=1 Tax=Streptomyces sp. NPDC001922 TaxID=3364624 RepID=UPI0036906BE2